MPRQASGRWPAYRRSAPPAGACGRCWKAGGEPVPGAPFVWGYPSMLPPGENPTVYYCATHAAETRALRVTLIPRQPRLQLVKGGAP